MWAAGHNHKGVEAIALRLETFGIVGWRPSLLGWLEAIACGLKATQIVGGHQGEVEAIASRVEASGRPSTKFFDALSTRRLANHGNNRGYAFGHRVSFESPSGSRASMSERWSVGSLGAAVAPQQNEVAFK